MFVRINPLDSGLAMAALAAVVGPGLAGVMLPKTQSVADIVRLGHGLDALEARADVAAGSVQIIPVATETPQAMLNQAQATMNEISRLWTQAFYNTSLPD